MMQLNIAEPIRDPLDSGQWTNGSVVEQFLTRLQACAQDLAIESDDGESRALGVELSNKLELFCEFERVRGLMQGEARVDDILELASRPAQLPAPLSIWSAMAIGYYASIGSGELSGIQRLLSSDGRPLIARMLIPIHQGMGCAFAEHVLAGISKPSAGAIDTAIAEFCRLSRENADKNELGTTLETFGFMTRQLLAAHVRIVADRLQATCPELIPSFWHGVGRATYCGTINLVPTGDGQRLLLQNALDIAQEPHERTSAIAGFAWGVTVTNLGDPAVVERLLDKLSADPSLADSFSLGVSSALQVLGRCTTDDAINRFAAHTPTRQSRSQAAPSGIIRSGS